MLATETGFELRIWNVRALPCWACAPLLAHLTLFFVSRFGFFRRLGTFLLLGFWRFGLFLPRRLGFLLALMSRWSGFALRFRARLFGSRLLVLLAVLGVRETQQWA